MKRVKERIASHPQPNPLSPRDFITPDSYKI